MAALKRRSSVAVKIGNVWVGGNYPIVVQSMTNTDTADVMSTVNQVMALAQAGSEMVRVTVNVPEAAQAVPEIKKRMLDAGVSRALVAPPPPTEESGRWSEWKERGLPLGTLGVADILGRLDDLGTAVRVGSTRPQSVVGRVGPAAAVAGVLVTLALVGLLVFLFTHGHQLTTSPGCSHPTQGGC